MPRENIQYFIKDIIVFNALDNSLWSKDNPEDTLTIGLVPGRLFRYLLVNAGRVVSKDELLSSVWDAYGLRSSGHSLNQNISLLRKSLTILGCESEVISTLHRLGYLINHDVVDTRLCTTAKIELPKASHKTKKKKFHFPLQLLAAGCLSLALLTVITSSLMKNNAHSLADIPVQPMQLISGLEGCSVFTTRSGRQTHEKLYVLARSMITAPLSPCRDKVFYIISADDSVMLSGAIGRVFLTRCLQDVKTKIISGCDTIYERDYAKKN